MTEIDELTPSYVMANLRRNCAELSQLRNDRKWQEVEIRAQKIARDLLLVAYHAAQKQE